MSFPIFPCFSAETLAQPPFLCYTDFMKLDYNNLYARNVQFLEKRPLAKKLLPLLSHALTSLFFVAYAGLLIYLFKKDFGAVDRMKAIFAPLTCLLLVTVLRLAIDRPRPYSAEGAGIIPYAQKKGQDNKSFPSRHLACAAVISVTFFPYFLAGGIILSVFAVLLALIRFSLGLHYPTDLLAGLFLGAVCGCIPFFM